MTAPTLSAYPRTVDELLPDALKLAVELSEIPSRNRLMREFRIGAPKADEVRVRLVDLLPQGSDDATGDSPPDPWHYGQPVGPDPADRPAVPEATPLPAAPPAVPAAASTPQVDRDGHPDTQGAPATAHRAAVWPVVLLALPAFVAIWSGWVGLGGLTGFGVVHPLPGIADGVSLNTAITLPIGVETYGAYALYVWLSGRVPLRARRFAKWSAIASLVVGAGGQVAYHLLVAAGVTSAPWQITTAVSCLPVAVLGMGAALAHLVREGDAR